MAQSTELFEISSGDQETDDVQRQSPVRVRFTFKDIRYSVETAPFGETKGTARRGILHGIQGQVYPGETLAIMGPSGSGKTSLLNALSGRLSSSTGRITLNDVPWSKEMKRLTSYVLQDDILHDNLTVRETLQYTGELRLSKDLTREQKYRIVDQTIAEMGLTECQHSTVGSALARGVSGGERKRVNIGNEILNNPSVLMLDECTSGLDSTTAKSVLDFIKKYAQDGRCVLCSIHQPSSQIFHQFDKVLFLSHGSTIFYGPPGEAVDYFSSIGYTCYPQWNPADFIMDLASDSKTVGDTLIHAFQESTHAKQMLQLDQSKETSLDTIQSVSSREKWQTTWTEQLRILCRRSFVLRRGETFQSVNLVQTVILAFALGFIWYQLGNDEGTIDERLGVLFFTCTYWMFNPAFNAMYVFPMERGVLMKERATGSYRMSAYFISKTISEVPFLFLYPTVYIIINYWLVGLNPNFARFVLHILVIWLVSFTSESFGYAASAAILNPRNAIAFLTIFLLFLMIIGGFYADPELIPNWIGWLQYVSIVRYGYYLLARIEFVGESITCAPTLSAYNDCPGTIDGINVLKNNNIDVPVWESIIGLLLLALSFRCLAYYFLRRNTAINS